MISFEHINDFDKSYDFNNHYLRFSHNHLYYKKVHIVGRENIPPRGTPTFVISNHQNGLMDALAILYLFNDARQPVFIARGDIFKKDFVARMLRYLKILPAFRSRDGGREDMKRNLDLMELEARILREGGTLAMFPEAGHQAGHFMTTFKKGFPRIAFKAEETSGFALNLQILPLNIHYSNYFNFRSELLVTVGKPFTFSELFELYKTEPNNAYLALNEKARAAVKAMTLDVEDREHYEEYSLLCSMWHTPLGKMNHSDGDALFLQEREDMDIVRRIDELKTSDAAAFDTLMANAREFADGLEKLKLRHWLVNATVTLPMLMLKALLLLLLSPFALFGFVNNAVPFYLPTPLINRMNDKMFSSSVRFALSVLISFPLWYLILLVVVWIVSGKFWVALCYLPVAFASLYLFYAYKKWAIKWWASFRYYRMEKSGLPLLERLKILKNSYLCKSVIEK